MQRTNLWLLRGRRVEEGRTEFRISKCKLLYTITGSYCIAQGTIFNILG